MRERAAARGAISVEISARFDGSVVSVHHLVVGPRGLTWPTRLLYAAGALGLIGSVALLGAAAHGASGHLYTVAFGVAVLVAASCLPLAGLRRVDECQPRDFTVGPGRGVDLPLPADLVPEPRFALVRMTGGGFELCPPYGASRPIEIDDRAHMILGGVVLQITAGLPPRRYRLEPPTRWLARLTEGATGVWIVAWLAILLPIAAAVVGALYQQHDRGHSLFLDPAEVRHARIAFGPEDTPATPQVRTAQSTVAHARRAPAAPAARALATIPQDTPAAAQAPVTSDAANASADHAEASAAAQAESGAEATADNASATAEEQPAADRAALAKRTAVASAGPGATAPSRDEVQQLARAQAARSPLLGLFRGSLAGAGSALAGGNGHTRGDASGGTREVPTDEAAAGARGAQGAPGGASGAADPMGSLVGEEIGEAYGVGGLGLVGSGAGGGGSGEGTIGLGDIGTIGYGGGSGTGYGYGTGCGGLGGRSAQAPSVSIRAAEVRGALDKELIRRVVRAHVNQVRFCYEQELQEHPTLEGRVLIGFTIAESGAVLAANAEASSLARGSVGTCIASAVRRWTFPSARSHGVTEVHYPFALHYVDQ